MHYSTVLAAASLLPLALSQLTGSVGPLTSSSKKAATKTCDVTSYGAKADKTTDLGPPLASAFAACKNGGLVKIPAGDFLLRTFQTLSGGTAWALQLDGAIYRDSSVNSGNMLTISEAQDFELFSSNGNGTIQGYGYVQHKDGSVNTGPRLIQMDSAENFSIHDIKLVDAPSFHAFLTQVTNGEVYNILVRGANQGGTDGIDITGNNIWAHDIEVTNKDECVTIKSPSQNILVEQIYCNWSGGCAMGSFSLGTAVSNVLYNKVYTYNSNQAMMIKSNKAGGTLENVVFENFISHGNAYTFNIDSYWSGQPAGYGDGLTVTNVTANNWKGTEANGSQRGPIQALCPDAHPCTDITLNDFALWTDAGSTQIYKCRSAYGSGGCLKQGGNGSGSASTSYAEITQTATAAPAGYSAPKMADDIVAPTWGVTAEIPVPTWPASFFPDTTPISALAAGSS